MNMTQFIILTIFFLTGIVCQIYNLLIQLEKEKLSKTEFLLQIAAILSMIVVYGLGVITTFAGIYNYQNQT